MLLRSALATDSLACLLLNLASRFLWARRARVCARRFRAMQPPVGLLLGAMIAGMLSGCGPAQNDALVSDGYADLRETDLSASTVALRGEWLAWDGPDNTLVATYDYDDSRWKRVEMESPFESQGFPIEGAVWYRVKLSLPLREPDAPPISGFVSGVDNAHAVYAATAGEPPRLVASSGTPSARAETTVRSRRPTIFFLPRDTSVVLTLHVASYDYLSGGTYAPVTIAAHPAMLREMLQRFGAAFGLGSLFALLTLICTLLWWLNRSDVRWIALANLSLWIALRVIALEGIFEILMPGRIDFAARIKLELLPTAGTITAVPLMLWTFFPDAFDRRLLRRVGLRIPPVLARLEARMLGSAPVSGTAFWTARMNAILLLVFVALGLTFFVGVLIGTPYQASVLLRSVEYAFVGGALWTVGIGAHAAASKYPMGWGMLAGLAILALGGIHDMLRASGILQGAYLGGYAFLLFIGIQVFNVARRNAAYAQYALRSASEMEVEVQIRTREFRAASIAAQAANLTKGRFLAAVSHDLRTPLATLLGYLDVLRDELDGSLSPTHREFFEFTTESAERLRDRVNDMLDLTHLDAGGVLMQLRPVGAAALARRVAEEARDDAEQKGLELSVVLDQSARPLFVRADPSRLHQALAHLTDNAIKFTERGSVTLRVLACSPEAAAQSARHEAVSTAPPLPTPVIRFEIVDTGVGIAPEFLPRLFERFAQDAADFERSQRGTGLGLALAALLVQHMGGRITVFSERGEGTAFRVDLPLAEGSASGVSPAA